MRLPLKDIWKLQLVQNLVVWGVMCAWRPHTLHLCFTNCINGYQNGLQIQSQVPVLTFKGLHGMGAGYLREHLFSAMHESLSQLQDLPAYVNPPQPWTHSTCSPPSHTQEPWLQMPTACNLSLFFFSFLQMCLADVRHGFLQTQFCTILQVVAILSIL